MPKVLLTGITGFIASHILDQLVKEGYSVVGTLRSISRADFIKKKYPDADISFEPVADISVLGSFDSVFQKHPDIDYVLHTASPFHFNITDPEKELIIPAINGTKSVLEAAKKYGKNVKKVVVLSSYAAVFGKDDPVTEKSWCPYTLEEGKEDPLKGYVTSKALAEKTAWDFLKDEKPNFALSTICVPYVFGPVISDITVKNINTSNGVLLDLIDPKDPSEVSVSSVPYYVDVRDVAKSHLDALKIRESDGKRLLITPGKFAFQDFVDIYREKGPKKYVERLAIGKPGTGEEIKAKQSPENDNHVTNELLGFKYIPYEQTIIDTITNLIELKDKSAS